MLDTEFLREHLQAAPSNSRKCFLALAHINNPAAATEVSSVLLHNGLPEAGKWNVSRDLSANKGLVINVSGKWSLTSKGNAEVLKMLGRRKKIPAIKERADLITLLEDVSDPKTKSFLTECVACLEYGLHRSAVVMSWLSAVHVLKLSALDKLRKELNAEIKSRDPSWRYAQKPDDLSRLQESDLLNVMVKINMLQKNTKQELESCLKRRNSCGHPNSYELSGHTVAHHLEILILNVFKKFT